MNKEVLRPLVEQGLSTRQIGEAIGKSQTATCRWLQIHGFKTRKRHSCKCGEEDPAKFSPGRYSECRKCRVRFQVGRYQRYKAESVAYKGGKCVRCGYNKCVAAMDFHHRDPGMKDPNWIQARGWTPKRLRVELDKCDLLCANCHREVHYDEKRAVA